MDRERQATATEIRRQQRHRFAGNTDRVWAARSPGRRPTATCRGVGGEEALDRPAAIRRPRRPGAPSHHSDRRGRRSGRRPAPAPGEIAESPDTGRALRVAAWTPGPVRHEYDTSDPPPVPSLAACTLISCVPGLVEPRGQRALQAWIGAVSHRYSRVASGPGSVRYRTDTAGWPAGLDRYGKGGPRPGTGRLLATIAASQSPYDRPVLPASLPGRRPAAVTAPRGSVGGGNVPSRRSRRRSGAGSPSREAITELDSAASLVAVHASLLNPGGRPPGGHTAAAHPGGRASRILC
jgi:hypothetical protein